MDRMSWLQLASGKLFDPLLETWRCSNSN